MKPDERRLNYLIIYSLILRFGFFSLNCLGKRNDTEFLFFQPQFSFTLLFQKLNSAARMR